MNTKSCCTTFVRHNHKMNKAGVHLLLLFSVGAALSIASITDNMTPVIATNSYPCDPDPDVDGEDCTTASISNENAVFVSISSDASVSGNGTMDAPYKEIQTAIFAAANSTSSKKAVYISAGTYESSTIKIPNGVSIFGGFDSSNSWTRSNGNKVVIQNDGSIFRNKSIVGVVGGYLTEEAVIDRIDINTPDTAESGTNNYGLYCFYCPGLNIQHCAISAGSAGDGADGTDGAKGSDGDDGEWGGEHSNFDNYLPYRANGGFSSCSSGAHGGRKYDSHGGLEEGSGERAVSIFGSRVGYGSLRAENGADGLSGFPGSNGQDAMWSFDDGLGFWHPTSATKGESGEWYRAGSGGGADWSMFSSVWYAGGGGGGSGCGGEGGLPGESGGVSIAVDLLHSTCAKVANSNTLMHGTAGQKGVAGKGGAGGYGGDGGGVVSKAGYGGDGGNGGSGGDAGASLHGFSNITHLRNVSFLDTSQGNLDSASRCRPNLHDSLLAWEEAWEKCKEEHDGILVEILNDADNNRYASMLGANQTAWIGIKYNMRLDGRYEPRDETWRYTWDFRRVSEKYTNWAPGDPAISGGSNQTTCAVIRGSDGKWETAPCDTENQVICGRSARNTSPEINECAIETNTCAEDGAYCKKHNNGYNCLCEGSTVYDPDTWRQERISEDIEQGNKCKQPRASYLTSNSRLKVSSPVEENFDVQVTALDALKSRRSPLIGGVGEFVLNGENEYEHVVDRLFDAGAYLHVLVTAKDGSSEGKVFMDEDVRIACGCQYTDFNLDEDDMYEALREGQPLNIEAWQRHGKVFLAWTGDSRCAEGFSLGRRQVSSTGEESNDETALQTFASTFITIGADECGRKFKPGHQAHDDIEENDLVINSEYEYCVEAVTVSSSKPSHRSGNGCIPTPLQIRFEHELRVFVNLGDDAGHLPVGDVEITWRLLENEDALQGETGLSDVEEAMRIQGSGKTGPDGFFKIYIRGSKYHDLEVLPLHLTFHKSIQGQNGTSIEHKFECPDEPDTVCNEATIMVRHLDFSHKFPIIDLTSAPVTGRVYFDATDGLCPVREVKICLEGKEGLIDETCSETDAQGEYHLAAPYGMHVRPAIDGFHNHTFQYAGVGFTSFMKGNEDEFIKIEDGGEYHNIDFADITEEHVTVELAGGKCDILFAEKIQLRATMTQCPEWDGMTFVQGHFEAKHAVPAAHLTIQVDEVVYDPKENAVDVEATEYFSGASEPDRSQVIDLLAPDGSDKGDDGRYHGENTLETNETKQRTIRFEYHPVPTLDIEFISDDEDQQQKQDQINHYCTGPEDIRWTLPESSWATAVIRAKQEFSKGNSCSHLDGGLLVRHNLGASESEVDEQFSHLNDDAKKSLTACPLAESGCQVSIEPDSEDSENITLSKAEFRFFVGAPSLANPFTKQFQVIPVNGSSTMISDGMEDHIEEIDVAVIGSVLISDLFSVSIPVSRPLATVRDPPGGLSYAEYTNVRTHYSIQMGSTRAYNKPFSGNIKVNGHAGAEVMTDPASLGMRYSTVLSSKGGTGAAKTDIIAHDVHHKTTTLTVKWSMKTASDPDSRPGRDSDMLLIPALIANYLEVSVIDFDTENCKAVQYPEVQYSVNKGNQVEGLEENQDGFAWVSVHQVENRIIPTLEQFLDNPQGEDETDAVEEAIADWRKLLTRHDNPSHAVDLAAVDAKFMKSLTVDDGSETSPSHSADGAVPNSAIYKHGNELGFSWSDGIHFTKTKTYMGTARDYIGFTRGESSRAKEPHASNYDSHRSVALAPVPRIEHALSLNGGRLSESEKEQIRKAQTISFTGGGSLYSITTAFNIDTSEEHLSNDMDSFKSSESKDAAFKVDIVFPGFGFGVNGKSQQESGQQTLHTFTTGDKSDNQKFTMTLGDPEIDDYFDVTVAKDQDGFMVFNTTGGQSSCFPEKGTHTRHQPKIEIVNSPLQPAHPDDKYVYNVRVYEQSGDDGRFPYEIYDASAKSTLDGATVAFGGRSVHSKSVLEEGLGPSNIAENIWDTIIEISRGPELFDYPDLQVGIRPLCRTRRLDIENPGDTYVANIPASFYEPCPAIELKSRISPRYLSTIEESLNLDFRNRDEGERKWSSISHVDSVWVQYQPARETVIDANWQDLPEANLTAIEHAGSFGFARYVLAQSENHLWRDGTYLVRGVVRCKPTGHPDPSLSLSETEHLRVIIDTQRPEVSGAPRPVSQEWLPGNEISVKFSERIECSEPYSFSISLVLNDLASETGNTEFAFSEQQLTVWCLEASITAAFPSHIRYRDIIGLRAVLTVSNVCDRAQNCLSDDVVHEFDIVQPDESDLNVEIQDLPIIDIVDFANGSYPSGSQANKNMTEQLTLRIVEMLDVSPERVHIEKFRNSQDQNMFFVDALVYPLEDEQEESGSRRLRALQNTEPTSGDILGLLDAMDDVFSDLKVNSQLGPNGGMDQDAFEDLRTRFFVMKQSVASKDELHTELRHMEESVASKTDLESVASKDDFRHLEELIASLQQKEEDDEEEENGNGNGKQPSSGSSSSRSSSKGESLGAAGTAFGIIGIVGLLGAAAVITFKRRNEAHEHARTPQQEAAQPASESERRSLGSADTKPALSSTSPTYPKSSSALSPNVDPISASSGAFAPCSKPPLAKVKEEVSGNLARYPEMPGRANPAPALNSNSHWVASAGGGTSSGSWINTVTGEMTWENPEWPGYEQ